MVIEKRFSEGYQISSIVEQENGNMRVLLPADEVGHLKQRGLRVGRLMRFVPDSEDEYSTTFSLVFELVKL